MHVGAQDRRDAKRVVRRELAARHVPQLPVVAESLELAVAADAGAAAGVERDRAT